jgi:PAS domain-containing protein
VAALTRLQPSAPAPPTRSTRFCSRCGAVSEEAARRVCDACEEGVLLTCRSDALPGEAFLICTYELEITAVSQAGEEIFGAEDGLLGTQLLDLATCPLGDDQLARHMGLAAQRPREPVELPMRLRSEQGEALGTLAARVTTCGPPRAALLTAQPTGFGRR